MDISWLSFLIGLALGFIAGAVFMSVLHRTGVRGEDILAWVISGSWIVWHIGAGLGLVDSVPPTMYDVVSGGAVGFILGERFFDYLANSVGRVFRK